MFEALLVLIGGMGLVFLGLLYGAFSYGLIVYKCYYWFLIPVFTTLPHITIYEAIGLSIFLTLFKGTSGVGSYKITYKKEVIKTDTKWANILVSPWIFLLMAYLVKCIFL